MASELEIWWDALRVATLVNAVLWAIAAWSLFERKRTMPAPNFAARRLQLWLACVYVVVCGFRSFLPRADVQRICLVDSAWSSVFVGRTVATVAELCFALQWALYVRELADGVGSRPARALSRVLFPLIVWAETASWYAVITSNFLGNAIEQSTWTLCGVLIATSYLLIWPRAHAELRRFMAITGPAIACFVVFMCRVDVPMYWTRWRADQLAGREYLGFFAGVHDAATRWIVAHDWLAWRDESAWMALYFSVGVWVSIALSQAPSAIAERAEVAAAPALESRV